MTLLKKQLWNAPIKAAEGQVSKQVSDPVEWQVHVQMHFQVHWQIFDQVIDPLRVMVGNQQGVIL